MRRRAISTGKWAADERGRQCRGDVAFGGPRSRTARVGGAAGRRASGPGRLGGGLGDGGNRQDDGAGGSQGIGEGGRYADPERAGRGRRGRAAVLAVAQRARAGSGLGLEPRLLALGTSPPAQAQFLAVARTSAALLAAAPAAGLVVVLDDLQWADAASWQLLRHLAADVATSRAAHRRGHSGPESGLRPARVPPTSDRCRWGRGLGRTSARTYRRWSVARSIHPGPRTCTAVAPEFRSLSVNSSGSSSNPAVSTPRRPNLGCRAHCDRCWSVDSTP